LAAVSQRLRQQISAFDPGIETYAEYALVGQGKQLRPLLVALGANVGGRLNDSHVTVAVIIEMVHLATLVHDDVMDEADIRRGRRTLAANWGNEIAVLLGDCLFAHALKLAASFPTPEICRAVASATNTVCSGEILQTRARDEFGLTLEKYFKMLGMKTGELFALSCELGGNLAGAPAGQQALLREFGMALGTAYQLYDDCVDIFGSEKTAGKSLGTDLQKGKLTLPVILLREKVSPSEREQLEALVKEWQPASMPLLREMLSRHGIAAGTLARFNEFAARARSLAAQLPGAPLELAGLVDYLALQTEGVCA
jgi:octaprenyl-diphosphate synthase